jgi:RimJ/RimL family protein N-acetyltransferase
MTVQVRLLAAGDAMAYRAFRLRGLEEHPTAFLSSAHEEAQKPLEVTLARVSPPVGKPHDFFMGAFDTGSGQIVGAVGLQGRYRPKEAHVASVVGMYVAAECAGQGVGLALMQALLQRCRDLPSLEELNLTLTGGNIAAQKVYDRCGFTVWGVLPRALKLDGQYHDKVHMRLSLRGQPAS